MKSKLFAALVGLVLLSGSLVNAHAQDNNEAEMDNQAQVPAPDNGQTQDESQYENQPQNNQAQDDNQSQYGNPSQDNQAQYDNQAQDNTPAPPNSQGPQSAQALSNQDTAASDAGVARVSFIHGDVSTQRGDSGDWATAALNAPVVAGDRVAAGSGSRAELQLDYANILRIDERTQANITNLSKTQIQVQIASGVANYSVLKDSEADVEIDAPNLSVHPGRGDGNFHITIFSDERAEVIVRRGEADISTPEGSRHLRAGQSIIVTGAGNNTQSRVAGAPARDDFDQWTSDRDNKIRNAQSWSRTNQYYVGSEDLDAYGHWTNVPDYGNVWQPAVGSDWAPYRDGRWVWEPYWGWTWVSNESWGWAPYHYGRWFMYGSSWVWWPGYSNGYRHYRPVWAPAYVSFFGFGSGVGVGFSFGGGFGSVGWLPVGPCDGYYPWWGRHRNTFNVVNIYNVHNVYNIHRGGIAPLRTGNRYSNLHWMTRNDRVRNGVSTVSAHDFGRGRITARPVSREMFRDGRMVAGNLPVVPGRESLLAGQRRAAPPTVRGGQNERFFGTKHNAPATTRSFDREASDVRNAIQRDGRFTPIVGNQRANTGDRNGRGSFGTGQNAGATKPSAGVRGDSVNRGPNQNQNPNASRNPNLSPNLGNSNSLPTRQGNNADWRRSAGSRDNGAINNGRANSGNANNNNPNNGNPGGRVTTPADRPARTATPQGNGNQDWRRMDRPSGAAVNRSQTEAPASRDRIQRAPSQPTQDRGTDWRRAPASDRNARTDRPSSSNSSSPARGGGNDWRRMPTTDRGSRTDRPSSGNSAPSAQGGTEWRRAPAPQRSAPVDRPSSSGSAPSAQRDSGSWRQPAPRSSRPSLDMRQPIVTPRNSRPPNPGNYRGNEGGYSAPRSAPSRGDGGGYSAPRSAPSGSYGGGGYSAPRSAPSGGYGGGGYSAPRSAPSGGGGGHFGGGGGGGHAGGGGHSAGGRPHR